MQLKGKKLNQLLQAWPKNTVATSYWIREKGINYDLLSQYRRSQWVTSIGHGAVIRTGDEVDWTGGVFALQKQLNLSTHPGGKTALSMQGYSHYLSLGKNQLTLFSNGGDRPPKWFLNYSWDIVLINYHTKLFPENCQVGLIPFNVGNFDLIISSPERAIFEILYTLPGKESFEGVWLLFEGLTTMNPDILQELLEKCTSVKVKRLFMVLAEYHQHGWFKRINKFRIDFGIGKRSLVTGGYLHSKYKITIPHTWKFVEEEGY
jgi:hypothetical protein